MHYGRYQSLEQINNNNHINRYSIKRQFTTRPTVFALLVLIGLGWLGYHYSIQQEFWTMIDEINLGIHELGHIIFALFNNTTIEILGGSILQIVVPIIFIYAYWHKKKFFPVAICIRWLGSNVLYISKYIYDATRLQMDMVSLTGNIETTIHDRNYLLSQWGLLSKNDELSFIIEYIGLGCMVLSIIYGIYLIINKHRRQRHFKQHT